MSKKRVIGISGVARAGKDTFASILEEKLKSTGHTVDRFAFANALKQDCDEFCKLKLGISAFTQDPVEKLIIRPLLVWYGDAKRKQSNGRYWVDIIDTQVKNSSSEYCLVTDVRYDFYDRDEIDWVKKECDGLVVHVSRWTKNPLPDNVKELAEEFRQRGVIKNLYSREFVPPANDHEAINDPKVKAKADCIIEWENVDGLTVEELVHAPTLVDHVDSFCKAFKLPI